MGFTKAVVCSNVEHLKFFAREVGNASAEWKLAAEVDPERKEFNHLKYAPFVLDLDSINFKKLGLFWGDLRIDGFIGGKQVISKSYSGSGVDMKFTLLPDDETLFADGADATRVVLRVTDEFDAIRTYADDPIQFTLEGPGELIGDNPFSLVGGTGAVWVRAKETAGTVKLTAKHPRLGSKTVTFKLMGVAAEAV